MIDPKLGYSIKTQELIERMCRNVERSDFVLDKELSEELIMKTYDLFNLPRPKKVKWCLDLEDKDCAWNAWSDGNAWSARNARNAWNAWNAGNAWSDGNARNARNAWSARNAWNAWNAGNARNAWSALDYDFDWFIFEYEYCENPDINLLPNANDKIYLEYCELLMQAKEAGLGYRVEFEDTLYLVPTPLVKINSLNQFHNENGSAIRWKGGQEIYYLNGVMFEKELYYKVISPEFSFEDRLKIKDIDQRTQALNPKFCNIESFLKTTKAELLDDYSKYVIKMSNGGYVKSEKDNPLSEEVNYKLYKIPKGDIFTQDAYYALFDCPSTRKKHFEGVEVSKTVPEAFAWRMTDPENNIVVTPKDWINLVPLVDEN